MRFGFLLSEIEVSASQILHGVEPDIPTAMVQMNEHVREALSIAMEVSREALDKVSRED